MMPDNKRVILQRVHHLQFGVIFCKLRRRTDPLGAMGKTIWIRSLKLKVFRVARDCGNATAQV